METCCTTYSTLGYSFLPLLHTTKSGGNSVSGAWRKKRARRNVMKPMNALAVTRGGLSPVRPPQTNPLMPGIEDLDTTNMLLAQRIIFLGSQVDDLSADFIISQLLLLDAKDPKKPIKFFINSPGGSVVAGVGIYDVMKLCKADVSTICFGLAASMGAFLLATGTKGKRYSMPNARIMIHQPWGGFEAIFPDLQIRVREMLYHKVKLEKIMARATGRSQEEISRDTDHDTYLNPWEAQEYGIIDAVIDENKPGLVAPIPEPNRPKEMKKVPYFVYGKRRERKPALSEDRLLGLIADKPEPGLLTEPKQMQEETSPVLKAS